MKSNTNISNIQTEFTLKNATSFAGSKPFLHFLENIHLKSYFEALGYQKAKNALYNPDKIFAYMIIGWTLGCKRPFHFRSIRQDALVKRFLGGRCPHHSLLYKELETLSKSIPNIEKDIKQLNQHLIAPYLSDSMILDFDSTVETVYGNQEEAAVGVNAHKPGRKSYHPLLVFEGKSRFCLNATLRPGNVHSSNNAIDFAKEIFQLLNPKTIRFARFDKGFGGEDFYSLFEANNIGYVGKLKWTKRLQKEVEQCRFWTRFVDDEEWIIEGFTLAYRATSWKKMRRVAIIRKARRFDDDDQLQFYDCLWEYEAIVTNLDWEPIDIWRFYNQRCCMENYIKEAKRGFSIDQISSSSYKANALDLLIKLLAYNLYERFKQNYCEPVHQGYTIQRFRQEFLQIPGILIKHSRKVILKLMDKYPQKGIWNRIMLRVANLN